MIVSLTTLTKTALANIGDTPSPRHGNVTGDSYLKNLTVLREELVINLSEIHKGKPVLVRATYIINCSQLLRNVDLVFVANNLTESRYRVDLDGHFVNGYLTEYDTIPTNWLPPDSIVWLGDKIPYRYTHRGLISFRFDSLTQGEHILIVDYDAEASEWFEEGDLAMVRTFVYILKPTDNWRGFENFHLVVFTPDNWELSSNLTLKRATSYSLSGDWSQIPDKYLSIAIRKPPTNARIYSIIFLVGTWCSFIFLTIFWMHRVIKYRLQHGKGWIIQFLNSVIISLLVTIFFFFIYFKNQDLLELWLDNQLNPLVTYGTGYYIMTFPFVWIIAASIIFLIDYIMTKRLKERLKY
ncbi:MAG: hypothetical protein KF846_09055 [Cyclobacteriaceae bacterium]|nr:hypothetical protein [Cyclobacteriaceae bacterium]